MKNWFVLILFLFLSGLVTAQENAAPSENRVRSVVDSSQLNELVLIQSFEVKAPLEAVWNVYSTKKGWESAFVAVAEVDFKPGGSIKTSYNKDAVIGDSSTIVLNIINLVPKKLITLQAELSAHFPAFMKADVSDFYNIIYLDALDDSITKVTSYGLGYKNNSKYLELMQFFIQGNEWSYNNLINYLETGIPVKH